MENLESKGKSAHQQCSLPSTRNCHEYDQDNSSDCLPGHLYDFFSGQFTIKFRISRGDHFVFPGLRMTLSNNFIVNPFYKYSSPNYISSPFRKESIDVYGELVSLTVFEYNDRLTLGDHYGSFFSDTVLQDEQLFKITLLEARVEKNGLMLRDWQPVNTMNSFNDSAIFYKSEPSRFQALFKVLDDSLLIGESLSVEFRSGRQPGFLKLTMKRKDAYTRPFLGAWSHDSGNVLIDVSRFGISRPQSNSDVIASLDDETNTRLKRIYSLEFYKDWPALDAIRNLGEFKAGENALFHFRQEIKQGKNVVLMYRLLGGAKKDTSWKKTYGLISFTSLEENSRYRLEVKYADGHGDKSVHIFFTASRWYQTGVFKLRASLKT